MVRCTWDKYAGNVSLSRTNVHNRVNPALLPNGVDIRADLLYLMHLFPFHSLQLDCFPLASRFDCSRKGYTVRL